MYNKDIKEAFISASYNDTSRKNIERAFNSFANLEEEQNTDVYYISYTELIESVFNLCRISSYKQLYDQMYYLKKYKEWCLINGIFSQEMPISSLEISSKELREKYKQFLKSAIIKNPTEFHQYLEIMFPDTTNSNYMAGEDFAKMYFLLLYEGISPETIYELTVHDVHIAANGVFVMNDNIMLQIKDEDLQFMLKKRIEKPMYGYPRYGTEKRFELSDHLIDFGNEIKSVKANMTKFKTVSLAKKELYDINPNYKTAFSDNNLYICGMMYRIKENETISNCKLKKKELLAYFPQKFTSSRWKKEQIVDIYNIWE